MWNRRLSIVLILGACACSEATVRTEDGGHDHLDGLVSIEVSPADAVLVIDGGVAASQEYVATGTFDDGSTRDITRDVTFTVDQPVLGGFAASTFVSNTAQGGQAHIRATAGDALGSTSLTLIYRQHYDDPGGGTVPADAATRFDDGSPSADLDASIVYPSDGVLVPPNLGQLELHWIPAAGTRLYEISYESPTTDVKVYTTCANPLNGGCIYTPDEKVWTWIAESNRGRTGVRVSIRSAGDDSRVGGSNTITIGFSQSDIEGGIYYWTTSAVSPDADSAIMRYDFASRAQAAPERFVGSENADGNCVGCHALSRDGSKMVVAADGSYSAYVLLYDVASATPIVPFDSTPRSAFTSWNPDGSRYVGVFANEQEGDAFVSYDLNVFDGADGSLIETIDVGGTESSPAAHPDWSPTGDRIAFTRIGSAQTAKGTLVRGAGESLAIVTYDGATWGSPEALTTPVPGQATYYPTFSPDGDLIAFNRSTCASGSDGEDCDSYDDPTATLYVMKPTAGAEPMALDAANAPGATDQLDVVENSFPKWAPFTFHGTSEIASRLHWLTFSSNRNYGLREPPAGHTLIWMSAVNPDAPGDPSSPAFALPFQDLSTDNHTAQWTERIVGIVQ